MRQYLWPRRLHHIGVMKRCVQIKANTSRTLSNKAKSPITQEKTMAQKLRPYALFGIGLYLGLVITNATDGKKKEESVYLKELRADFNRSSER